MESKARYEAFLRRRITELLEQKGISEHRLSLELGKSGSYIRAITNGLTLPSVGELFNIMAYFEITPSEFFEGAEGGRSRRSELIDRLRRSSEDDLEKVALFMSWIQHDG